MDPVAFVLNGTRLKLDDVIVSLVDSLALRDVTVNLNQPFFKLISRIDILSFYCENALKWIQQRLTKVW